MFKYKKSNECLNKFAKVYINKLFLLKIIDMKKLALLLFIVGMFTSCNDGDLVFDELNFSGNVQKCTDKGIYYKLNSNEMLFLYLSNLNTENLVLNQEYSQTINIGNEIVYRLYSDKAIAGSICSVISPAFPQVIDEFNVQKSGAINYKRVRKIEQNADDSRVTINYAVSFNFENIILSNGAKELKYENYNFGEYINSTSTLDFNLSNGPTYCPNSDILFAKEKQGFKIIGSDIQSEIEVGTQTVNLNATTFVKFYLLDQVTNPNEFCDMNFSDVENKINEEWTANEGVIEVITTGNATTENPDVFITYTTKYILKNAVFTNGTDSFKINEQILLTRNIEI